MAAARAKGLTNAAKVEHSLDSSDRLLLLQNKLIGTTQRLHSWYFAELDHPKIN